MLTASQIEAAIHAERALRDARALIIGAVFGLRKAGLTVYYLNTADIESTAETLSDALRADRDQRLAQHVHRRPAKVAA